MSGRKNNLVVYTSLDAGDMTGNLTSAVTDIRWLDNIVLYLSWTGTPTGTFQVEVSPEGSTWYNLLLVPAPAASGSASTARISLNQLPDAYIRVSYTATSSTGALTVKIAGKML